MVEVLPTDVPEKLDLPTGPKGIGGWLILVAIGQVLGPLRALGELGKGYSGAEMEEAFRTIPVTMYGALTIDVLYIVLIFGTSVAFFMRRQIFKWLFTWEIFGITLSYFLALTWVSATTNLSISKLVESNGPDAVKTIASTLAGLIWVAYVWRSQRVQNTFVR